MVADTSGVFFGASIGDIAHINRWLINHALPKKLFTWQSWSQPRPIDWKYIDRLFVVVEQPKEGTRLANGNLAIDHIQVVRAADWKSCVGFAPVAPDPAVAQNAVDYIVTQQCASTGLFRSWSDDPEAWAWLYDQGLALLILTREHRWAEADHLADFLVANQKSAGNNLFLAAGDFAADEWRASRSPDEENAEREMRQFVWCLPVAPSKWMQTSLESTELAGRMNDLPRGVVPVGSQCLTAAVDLGKYLNHWIVVAWSAGATSHIVDYGRIEVASEDLGVEQATLIALREFQALVSDGWPVGTTGGESMIPQQVWVDSGYMTCVVYAFCRQSGSRFRPAV